MFQVIRTTYPTRLDKQMREDEQPNTNSGTPPDDEASSLVQDEGKSSTLYSLHSQERVPDIFR